MDNIVQEISHFRHLVMPTSDSIVDRCRAVDSTNLTCVDLFAGAGGFSLAALRAGFRLVAAIESNRHACATYRFNIRKTGKAPTLYEQDIRTLNPETIATTHFPPGFTCDVVLGGPPCQGFSAHRINDAGVKDPRNELILRYFEFVSALRPKLFLMENVPGITWPRHRDYLEAFYRIGTATGYEIKHPTILDARDYGVPQRRKRIFILGIRNDVVFNSSCWPPPPTHGDEKARERKSALQPWVKATIVFDTPLPEHDENNGHMNHSERMVEIFRSTPVNGGSRRNSSRTLPCHDGHNGHNDVYGRIDPAQPGPTMTTACVNPSKGRFVHPTEPHGITIRQAARFQTFPDNFIFKGGLMASGTQIGNAVPIRLGEALLASLQKGLGATRKSQGSE